MTGFGFDEVAGLLAADVAFAALDLFVFCGLDAAEIVTFPELVFVEVLPTPLVPVPFDAVGALFARGDGFAGPFPIAFEPELFCAPDVALLRWTACGRRGLVTPALPPAAVELKPNGFDAVWDLGPSAALQSRIALP